MSADRTTSVIRQALPMETVLPLLIKTSSQLLLEEVERANLFIIPLDKARRWYRYHHLFAQVLRERLITGASPERVAALHRNASTWFEEQALIAEVVHYALLRARVGACGTVDRRARPCPLYRQR